MAKKDINVITSLVGKGLEREYLLLKELLNAHDVYTTGIHYCNWANSTLVRADINIFLEVVHPLAFNLSRENWLFPNSEWWSPINDQFLPRFTKICCKTRDCERIWKAKLAGDRPERVVYIGFEARDLYDPVIPRENRFLHVPGESEFKNTEAVVLAWRNNEMGNNITQRPPLTVVTRQKKYQDLCDGVPDVTCLPHRLPDAELARLMNSHRFHLLPSAYEGFGHALNEGIGCGALVVTTDAAPMNEFDGVRREWLVPVVGSETRSLARLNHVDEAGIFKVLRRAVSLFVEPDTLDKKSAEARAAFLSSREAFRQRFLALVGVA